MADDLGSPESIMDTDDPSSPQKTPGMTVESRDRPPSRLMITKMELENFKSYFGVKEIGPFHKCFSAVVGPNGSGKSNVIDAMLFVFGKRAKQLRLSKVRELIHKSDGQSCDYARVSVFMQEIIDLDDENFEVVSDSQCVITRTARQDNSSTYKLNDKTVQFKQIATFLNSKGIDLDNNRFLILQGEVEMISMMPPKGKNESDEGLLEYLEDIIGSNKFVAEANEKEIQLESLTEVKQEKYNRVKAVAKELECMKGAKEEAEALQGKEREIRRKQNLLYQIRAMEVGIQLEKHETQVQSVSERLTDERGRMAEAMARRDEIEKGFALQRLAYEKVYDELKQTKEEWAAHERKDVKLQEEIKIGKANCKKLEKKIEAEDQKHTDAIAKGEEAVASIPNLEQQILELEEQKVEEDAKLEVIHEETKAKTQGLRVELEKKTQELAPIQQERATFRNALETAETEVGLLLDADTRAKEKLQAAENELAELDGKQEKKRAELAACEDEMAQSKGRIVQAEQEDKILTNKETTLADRNKELLARSEEAKAALQSNGGGRSSAVDGLLNAARKGGELAKVGILGRLGDLATVPEEYDVAISTACGMLDHIVVQTTAGAQKCLDFLRKHGLGRANFIPLDKLSKGAHDVVVDTPEGAPRLFEMISPSNFQVTPAVFLGVGNTLVAPDLETATRWAYDYDKRWRVVTLDGKLIESAGTMAGGGTNVRRGGMRLANARSTHASTADDEELQDCERLESEAAKAMEMLQECRKQRKAIAEEIRTLKKTLKSLGVKIPKLGLEIDGCDTTRVELSKSIPNLRSHCENSKVDETKLVELNKKVSKCKTDLASYSMQASKLEADVARLQNAILDAGGTNLKKQHEHCEKIVANLKKTQRNLNSAKVAIGAQDKAAKKAAAAKLAAEKELEDCKQGILDKKAERDSSEEVAAKVMAAYEAVKALEAQKKAELEEAEKERRELLKAESDVKLLEIDLVNELEAAQGKLTECQGQKCHWMGLIAKLQADAAEDEEMEYEYDDDEPEVQASVRDDEIEELPEASEDDTDVPMKEVGASVSKDRSPRSALPTYSFKTLEKHCKDALKDEIKILETERSSLAKNANMGAIIAYRKKEADYLERVGELDQVKAETDQVRKAYDDLRTQRFEMFMNGFRDISLKLKEMYQMITLGGDAELELVDSLDPFSEGIVFSVRPPKKSWKNISNLSGGEKTLSSLALVFALHHFKPTPLYVMDEIDAALDFKNVSIVANYIKDRTKNAQFIIISLRNNMFELADRLVGIYKTNNCTKSVTIDPRAFGIEGQQNGFVPATPALLMSENANNRSLAASSAVKDSVRRRVLRDSTESAL